MFREKAAPGVRVAAMRSPEDVPVAMSVTGADGSASLFLPPGSWFLAASSRTDGDFGRPPAPGDRFAYYGGNPVHAGKGSAREIFLGIEEALPPPPVPAPSPGATGVAGRITFNGAPAAGVRVSAHLSAAAGFREPGVAVSAPTSGDGGFALELPPGKYYLVARRRASGGTAGPLRKGDLYGYFYANPVAVAQGAVTALSIPVTLLKLRNVPSYAAEYPADAVLEGRILGSDGRPRKGVHAALYDNRDLLGRPVFMSDATGEDGRYRLPVPVAGTYYLGARSGYGGQPGPGDFYGRYEGDPEHAVTMREGENRLGVDIVVEEIR
jgi:hypothetical protein